MLLIKKLIIVAISITGFLFTAGVDVYTDRGNIKNNSQLSNEIATGKPSADSAANPAQDKSDVESYDVVVFGGTPEGMAAALSSRRQGLTVCLVTEEDALGGVWANGMLNQLDNTYFNVSVSSTSTAYSLVSKGINEGFMKLLGIKKMDNGFYDGVFDVENVRPVFKNLLKDNDIAHVAFDDFSPGTDNRRVSSIGLRVGPRSKRIKAEYFIDTSENGDLAARAGCPYTLGRGKNIYGVPDKPVRLTEADYEGDETQMSSTLMFRLGGVKWEELSSINFNGGVDRFARSGNAGWGYNRLAPGFNNPQSTSKGVMLRGLNVGRQSDGSVLINSLLIFNVDGTSEESVRDGLERAKGQLPLVVDYLKRAAPAFKDSYLIDSADTLYIRESRHFIGEYILTLDDVLNGIQHYDTVALANHAVDIHPYTAEEASANLNTYGSLVDLHLKPKLYGIPFRSLLPMNIDNLVVVGRTISCTPKAAASARVISIGISEAQAAGALIGVSRQLDRPLKDLALDKKFWEINVIE